MAGFDGSSWSVKAMDSQTRILIIVFNVILVISTLFLNSLSITAIRKSSQLKNKLYYFVILIQSSVDFSFGVISIPALFVIVASPLLGIENGFFIVALLQTVIIVPAISLVTLPSITLERYIGVLYPYSYQTFVTKRRILIYLGVGCLILPWRCFFINFHSRDIETSHRCLCTGEFSLYCICLYPNISGDSKVTSYSTMYCRY